MAFGDVKDVASIQKAAEENKVDVVVSCLASRTGGWRGACGFGVR